MIYLHLYQARDGMGLDPQGLDCVSESASLVCGGTETLEHGERRILPGHVSKLNITLEEEILNSAETYKCSFLRNVSVG